MINRKSFKVGNVEVIFHNKIFELSKDTKKLKNEINVLISEINKLSEKIKKYQNWYDSFENASYIQQSALPKSKLENLLNEFQNQRMSLIDDLRNLSCFCCPITMELQNLDLDSQIQDLYSHISQKQDDLLRKLNLKHGCNAKQVHDPQYGDIWVGCRTYNNGTGVATDQYPFDKDINLYTQSENTINRTENDYNTNLDILDYSASEKDIYENGDGILTPEESMKNMTDCM